MRSLLLATVALCLAMPTQAQSLDSPFGQSFHIFGEPDSFRIRQDPGGTLTIRRYDGELNTRLYPNGSYTPSWSIPSPYAARDPYASASPYQGFQPAQPFRPW